MDRRKCIAVLGLLLFACSARAQTDPYFQWMNAITDDTLTPRMAAHLSAAGLSSHEQELAAAVLIQFKAEEFGLEESYNNLPSTLRGQNDGTEAFYARQAALVQRTTDKLRAILAADSFQHLDDRVQHESKNITTAKYRGHHSMLMNASFPAQLPGPMNPSYSLYHTTAIGPSIIPLTASMFVQSGGFNNWNPANLVDGNTSTIGFSTDTTQAVQYFAITFNAPQDITGIGMDLSAANYAGTYNIYYSDDNGRTYIPVLLQSYFAPSLAGYNYQGWPDAGTHSVWAFQLMNTPGVGPTINELQLIQPGAELYVTASLTGSTSCPKGCSNALHHGLVSNTLGPNVSGPNIVPTQYMHVNNAQSDFLPGDGDGPSDPPDPTVGVGGTVYCTQLGILQAIPKNYLDTQRERAITFSYISSIIDSNGMHPEAYFCSPGSSPPDWPGPDQAFPHVPSGQVVNIAFLFREYVHGTNPKGIPWNVYFPKFLPHEGIGYYVKNTFNAPSCTNWDNGYQNLSLPVPLIPQP